VAGFPCAPRFEVNIPEFDEKVALAHFIYPDTHTIQRTAMSNDSWRTVRARKALKFVNDMSYFAVKIEKYEERGANGWKIIVGVVDLAFNCNSANWIGHAPTFGYIAHTGNLSVNRGSNAFGEVYGKDDTISVTIDRKAKQAKFYKNGVEQGVHNFNGNIDGYMPAVGITGVGARVKFVRHFEFE
jgi:SPRY domain